MGVAAGARQPWSLLLLQSLQPTGQDRPEVSARTYDTRWYAAHSGKEAPASGFQFPEQPVKRIAGDDQGHDGRSQSSVQPTHAGPYEGSQEDHGNDVPSVTRHGRRSGRTLLPSCRDTAL